MASLFRPPRWCKDVCGVEFLLSDTTKSIETRSMGCRPQGSLGPCSTQVNFDKCSSATGEEMDMDTGPLLHHTSSKILLQALTERTSHCSHIREYYRAAFVLIPGKIDTCTCGFWDNIIINTSSTPKNIDISRRGPQQLTSPCTAPK